MCVSANAVWCAGRTEPAACLFFTNSSSSSSSSSSSVWEGSWDGGVTMVVGVSLGSLDGQPSEKQSRHRHYTAADRSGGGSGH